MTGERQTLPVHTTRTRIWRSWQARFALGCLLVIVLGAAWFAFRAWTVVTAVDAAQDQIGLAEQAYRDRDVARGAEHVSLARDELARARRASTDPVWTLVGALPLVGDEVRAVGAVAGSAAALLDAAEPLTTRVGDSGADPATIRALAVDGSLAPGLADLYDAAQAAQGVAAAWNAEPLHPVVADKVVAFGDLVGQVEPLLGGAAAYAALLPALLGGSDQPQDLLVAVQTPSEVRSLGGLAGLMLQVRAEGGNLTVVDAYSGSTVPATATPVLDTPALREHYDLYGDRAGRYMINATTIPDTTLAGPLLATFHERRTGQLPDAVVLLDLTVLSGLLTATGPVDLPDGSRVSADTANDLFQFGVYTQIEDPTAQDVFFAAAAGAIFTALTSPDTDPIALGRALAAAVQSDRLSVWSSADTTQRLVQDAALDGDLLADPSTVGVFLNDGTGAKLQYFLDARVSGPTPDGTIALELTSRVPDPASLPDYVAGQFDQIGVERGTQRVQVAVYGAVGSGPTEWRVDGERTAIGSASVDGRGVGVRSADIAPGQTVRVEVDLADPPEGRDPPWSLTVTPGISR